MTAVAGLGTLRSGGEGIGLSRPGGGHPGLSRSGRPTGSVLISSKLAPPAPAGLSVPRDQLVGWLASGKSRLLALVCAPAGYGKTTLLAQWCQAQAGGSCAWVTLDKGDSDPVRFWTYLICAIAGIEPAVGRASLQALSPQPDRLMGEALPRLLSELDEETREIALVLDDFHRCENDEVAGSLAFFVEHKPARVQVVVSCRSDPRLPLGRLRANGQLLEIRAGDLRFDDREAAAFFTLAGIGGLSSGDIQSLSQRAEGWPAALRLAAILLPAYEDRSGFARDFAGSNRQLADYMVTDVLAALPEAARAFLLRTCVLERLTAPLCDALTGAAGSGVTLRELSRAGVFITPVDATAEWYRYHQLFSGALRAELQITNPDLIPVLHARASCWFEQNGDLESATEHAIRARDLERSSRLVTGQLQPFIAIGRIATIERWLGDLSWPQAQQHPELATGRAAAAGVGGDLQAAERWLDVAAAGDRQTMTGAGVTLGFGVDLLRSFHALGNLRSAHEAAQRALREAPAPACRGAALTGLGQCQYLLGRTDDAAASLREALTLLPDDPYMVALAAGYLSLADTGRGNPGQGERGARTMLELLHARGLLGEARAELSVSVELCKSATPSIWHAHALILFAGVLHSLGEAADAAAALEQAEAILARLADPGSVPRFAREVRERLATPARRTAAYGEELTEREMVVLRLAAAGLTQRETGTQLYLSSNTVKTHLSRIYRKLGASSRREAVDRATELGML